MRMLFFQITDETATSYQIILIQVHVSCKNINKYSILIYALFTIKASHRWNEKLKPMYPTICTFLTGILEHNRHYMYILNLIKLSCPVLNFRRNIYLKKNNFNVYRIFF